MPLIAGILFGPATCVHCSRPTDGAGEVCACAAGFHDPRARRHDAAEILVASRWAPA